MMKLFTDAMADEGSTLSCLYKLSPPDPLAVEAREARVKEVIARMGNKYLLAKVHVVKRDE
jgi:hypothetical protein